MFTVLRSLKKFMGRQECYPMPGIVNKAQSEINLFGGGGWQSILTSDLGCEHMQMVQEQQLIYSWHLFTMTVIYFFLFALLVFLERNVAVVWLSVLLHIQKMKSGSRLPWLRFLWLSWVYRGINLLTLEEDIVLKFEENCIETRNSSREKVRTGNGQLEGLSSFLVPLYNNWGRWFGGKFVRIFHGTAKLSP